MDLRYKLDWEDWLLLIAWGCVAGACIVVAVW
jgi:hypothetical protein